MKRVLRPVISIILVCILMLTFVGCSSGGNSGASGTASTDGNVKTIRLKMNHTVAETSLWHTYSVKYAELIEERTQGRYAIDVFANEQLAAGSQLKTLEMLRAGTIDIDLHAIPIWAGIDERFSIVNMPWLFPNSDVADKFLFGEGGQSLLNLVWENGCVPIALGENGYRQVLNIKNPITKPEDMTNMKIRVPGMTMFIDFYRQLGADPTTTNWGEVFSALQQGTIDGMESPPEIIYSGRFQEVNKYMSMWNAAYDVLILSMSQKAYDGLSEEDRKIFMDTGVEVMTEQIAAQRAKNEECAKLLESEIEMYYPTEEEMKAFRAKVQPIYDQYADKFPDDLKKAVNYNE